MLNRRGFLVTAASLAGAGLLPARAADAQKISVGINAWIGYGPWYIAKEKGLDLANGIDIDFVNLSSNDDFKSTLAAGSVDSTHALITSALQYQAAGIKFRIALFQDISTTADAIIATPDITTLADLKGKTVGVPKESGGEYLLRLVLEPVGLTLDDLNLLDMQADQAAVAFIAGRVDAAVSYEPYIANAKNEVDGVVTLATAADVPGVISDIWLVTEDLMSEHPDAIVGMLRAWDAGVKALRADTEDGLETIAKATNTTADDLRGTFAGVELYDLSEGLAFMQNDLAELGGRIESIMRANDGLDGPTDFAALIDTSFAERALGS